MKNIFNHILILVLLVSCLFNIGAQASSQVCEYSKTCSISGMVIIKSDRGFIGELQIKNGKCINISLPEEISRRLVDKPPEKITVTGKVMPYPPYDEVLSLKVNGRKVGFGWCNDYYIFVEDGNFRFK